MRLALVIALLASASATVAHAAEDRYGPPRAQPVAVPAAYAAPAAAGVAAPYGGPMLSWGGKTALAPAAAPMVQAAPAYQPVQPQPAAYTPSGWRDVTPGAAAPRAAVPAPAPAPRPVAAAPLPTSLYDRPAPAAPQPRPAPRAQAPLPVQPQPQPLAREQAAAAALPPSPAAPRALAAAQPGGTSARAYSVVREFGGTPDPIDIPPPTSYWATRPGALAPMPGEAPEPDAKPVDDAAAPWNAQTATAGGVR